MKETTLIKYIRKPKTIMVPTIISTINDPRGPKENLYYIKQKIYYPRGVLVCVCRDGAIYIGWSYISNMAREEVQVGEHSFRVPSFVKKIAVKIAMDKINSKTKLWTRADMPIAVRKEFEGFAVRAAKYFKTYKFGNVDITVHPEDIEMHAEERSDNEEGVKAVNS